MADDEFIPFDPPIVSKYGPISRMSKTILRPNSSVQVSASFGDGTISTPMVRRPVPAASPVASWYFNAGQGKFQRVSTFFVKIAKHWGSIVTHSAQRQGCRLDGFECWEKGMFLCNSMSTPCLMSTCALVQWVLGAFSWGRTSWTWS